MNDYAIKRAVRAKRRLLERLTETNVTLIEGKRVAVEAPYFDQYELDAELADYEAGLRAR